jgi:uncharacterized membrane protein
MSDVQTMLEATASPTGDKRRAEVAPGSGVPGAPRGDGRGINDASAPAGPSLGTLEKWASALGGGALTLLGLRYRGLAGVGLAALGAGLIYRGMKPNPTAIGAINGLVGHASVTVDRPVHELFMRWADLPRLPEFMTHVRSVTVLEGAKSHWSLYAPAGVTIEYDAETVEMIPDKVIAWRSLPGADVMNRGRVEFSPAPGDRGTIVALTLEFVPPAGLVGQAVAKLIGPNPESQVRSDLRRFKQLMETGEIPTVDGQPVGSCQG